MKLYVHRRLLSSILLLCSLAFTSGVNANAWQGITGIPEPAYGVNVDAPAHPDDWATATAGFYYVDKSSPAATDSGNSFGSRSRPRLSVPSSIPAGSVVEIHGTYDSTIDITSDGTLQSPIFLRGESEESKPVLNTRIRIGGAYIVVENILTSPTPNGGAGISIREGASNVVIRNSELSGVGDLSRTGGLGIGSWDYAGNDSVRNVWIDNVFIHDIGDVNANFDQDAHGVTINGTVSNVWITNSEMTRTSGDGVQIEAQHNRGIDKIHHVYFGRNVSHGNKQTGFWVKHARDIVVSENEFFDFTPSDSSDGTCTGFQYAAVNIWFINNVIHDCKKGIGSGSGDTGEQENVYYVGNMISNIIASNTTDPHRTGGGIVIRMQAANHHLVNNTIYEFESGISAPINSGSLRFENNVMSGRFGNNGWDIYVESAASGSTVDNSVVHNANALKFVWNGFNYSSMAAFQNGTGECGNCASTSPQFVDVSDSDFHLAPSSPGIGLGVMSSVYADFQTRFGMSIDADLEGNFGRTTMPVSAGAYQVSGPQPEPPEGLE